MLKNPSPYGRIFALRLALGCSIVAAHCAPLHAEVHLRADVIVASAELPVNSAVATTVPQALEALLGDHLKNSNFAEAITAAYKARNFQPRWVSATGMNALGTAMQATFTNAHLYGMRPVDYKLPVVSSAPNLEEMARFDLAMTETALTYALHAMQGRISPQKVNALITPRRPIMNAADVLKTLFENDQPATAIRLYHPPHEGFTRLQAVLQKLLTEPKTAQNERDDSLLTAALPAQDKTVVTPTQMMIADIAANMERWRWLPREIGHSYVWVNIPSYVVQLKSLEEVSFETRTVVGAPKTPTPVFSEMMDHVIVNPSWHVPSSIARKEMLPALQRDATALSRKGIQVVSLSNGRVVDPATVDWSNTSAAHLPFAFRQPPSERNALGKIKFMFPNQHAVYLHDTPMKSFFGQIHRTFSHGCVRVQEPLQFADALFKGDENWSGEKIARLFGSGERRIDLKTPLPVHIVYFTLDADTAGNLKVLEDPYGYHRSLKALML